MDEDGVISGELGPMFVDDLPAHHRSGFVALVGKPNVGKSTLLNAWLGHRIAAVSHRPQTTRNRLLGILTRDDAQVVFVDTPGIHRPRNELGKYMVRAARRAIVDADQILFIVDASLPPTQPDRVVASLLASAATPVILAINKTDLVTDEELLARRDAYGALCESAEAVAISALTGQRLGTLLEMVVERLPQGPRFYPEDQLSDQHERFVAAELIRESLMNELQKELPYSIAVVVQDYTERKNGMLYISATIYTERDSQKGIVIGRGGSMLKRIGRDARQALEGTCGCKVYLDLWVKVRKGWRQSKRDLKYLGYGAGN